MVGTAQQLWEQRDTKYSSIRTRAQFNERRVMRVGCDTSDPLPRYGANQSFAVELLPTGAHQDTALMVLQEER